MEEKNNQIIIYNTEDGQTKLEVKIENETVWLSQKQMAELFDCTIENIIFHLQNVFKSDELSEKATTKDSLVVQQEGGRAVKRPVKIYNLDAIISVGYRINSLRGTRFLSLGRKLTCLRRERLPVRRTQTGDRQATGRRREQCRDYYQRLAAFYRRCRQRRKRNSSLDIGERFSGGYYRYARATFF